MEEANVPPFVDFIDPTFRFFLDGKVHTAGESYEGVADAMNLTDAQRRVVTPSGKKLTYVDRVGWAITYLRNAELLASVARGQYKITDAGIKLDRPNRNKIDIKFLLQNERFRLFYKGKPDREEKTISSINSSDVIAQEESPSELMATAFEFNQKRLVSEILDKIKLLQPRQFEKLVMNVVLKMGYGGSFKEAATLSGQGADEGVDAEISEDKLGIEKIYLQAKRWEKTVGRPDIQQFAGALDGKGTQKGIYITSSDFSSEARDYVKKLPLKKIVLINGEQLAYYMIEYGVGVSVEQTYEIKRIDSDYFEYDI